MEPLDYEEYISKNKVLLNNDPIKELLVVPPDSVQVQNCVTAMRNINYCVYSLQNILLETFII